MSQSRPQLELAQDRPWALAGLEEVQAQRLHLRWQLRRWNPGTYRVTRLDAFDWLAPLVLLMLPATVLAFSHTLSVAGGVIVGMTVACVMAVRRTRRRHLDTVVDRLVIAADRDGRRSVEQLIARCAGDLDELERRLSRRGL
jgi:hypothetical protein